MLLWGDKCEKHAKKQKTKFVIVWGGILKLREENYLKGPDKKHCP